MPLSKRPRVSSGPFLRWAGSKRQLVPRLKGLWSDNYLRYVEPFAGSAALFFAINPKRALLGDFNRELIDALRAVRDNPETVYYALKALPKGEKHYYAIRDIDPCKLSRLKRAARFIHLNRYCFNGIYRTNRKGEFNVPYGAERSGRMPTLKHFKTCAQALKRASILHADFTKTLKRVRAGDFVYLDPPYAVDDRRVFVEYSANAFTTEQIDALERWLEKIDRKGAHFVLSYIYCKASKDRFLKWKRHRLVAKRKISGFLGSRGAKFELRVTNIGTKAAAPAGN